MSDFTSVTGLSAEESMVENTAAVKNTSATDPKPEGTAPTTFSTLGDLPPDVRRAMEMGIAMTVCKRSQKSVKRQKEILDEARRHG